MKTFAYVGAITLLFSLGCTGLDDLTGQPEVAQNTDPCCCEYTAEGATELTHEEMMQSSCESWGYTCVEDAVCEEAKLKEAVAKELAEKEAAEKETAEKEAADATKAEEEKKTTTTKKPKVRRSTGGSFGSSRGGSFGGSRSSNRPKKRGTSGGSFGR